MHPHAQLVLMFFVETESRRGAQAGLDLLSSNSLPTLTSQSAGITGVSHCAQHGEKSSFFSSFFPPSRLCFVF